jgi:large subunit ribosomal protein L4
LIQKLRDGGVTVVEQLSLEESSTKQAVELLSQLNVSGRAVLVDVNPGVHLERSVRNLPRVRVVRSNQLTARDVAGSTRLVMTRSAVEHLEKVLAS